MTYTRFSGSPGIGSSVRFEEIRDAVISAVNLGSKLVVVIHENPDPDAISSALLVVQLIYVWTGEVPIVYVDGETYRADLELFSSQPLSELVEVCKEQNVFVIACDCHDTRAANVCRSIIDTATVPLANMSFDHHIVATPKNLATGMHVVDKSVVAAVVLILEMLVEQYGSLASAAEEIRDFDKLAAWALMGIITDAPDARLREELEDVSLSCKRGQSVLESLIPLCDRPYYEKLRADSRKPFEAAINLALESRVFETYDAFQVITAFIGLVEQGYDHVVAQVADELSNDADLVVIAGVTARGLKFAFRNGKHQRANDIAIATLGVDQFGRNLGGGHGKKAGGLVHLEGVLNRRIEPGNSQLCSIGLSLFGYYTKEALPAALHTLG